MPQKGGGLKGEREEEAKDGWYLGLLDEFLHQSCEVNDEAPWGALSPRTTCRRSDSLPQGHLVQRRSFE